jgi:hypothetical protein
MRNLKLRNVKPVPIGNEEIGRARQPVSIYVQLDSYRQVGMWELISEGLLTADRQ